MKKERRVAVRKDEVRRSRRGGRESGEKEEE